MAKRGMPEHSKIRRLMRTLDIPKYSAVGLLECLWHLTAKEAPSGDIGKLDNEDIALQVDWRGDPDTLINALIQSRWLDQHPIARLLIHDWAEHREDTVDNWLARNGHRYADGSAPRMNRLKVDERADLTAKYFSSSAQEAHAERTKSAMPSPAYATATARPEPGRATPEPEPEPGQTKPKPFAHGDSQQPNGTAASLAAPEGGAASPSSAPAPVTTTATATAKAAYERAIARGVPHYPAVIEVAGKLFSEKSHRPLRLDPRTELKARKGMEAREERYTDLLGAVEIAITNYAAKCDKPDWIAFWRDFDEWVVAEPPDELASLMTGAAAAMAMDKGSNERRQP